jgi:hypothetical protein
MSSHTQNDLESNRQQFFSDVIYSYKLKPDKKKLSTSRILCQKRNTAHKNTRKNQSPSCDTKQSYASEITMRAGIALPKSGRSGNYPLLRAMISQRGDGADSDATDDLPSSSSHRASEFLKDC